MCQSDTNAPTQGHYMTEKYLYRTHIRGSTYGVDGLYEQGYFSIEHGEDMVKSFFLLGQVKRKISLKHK